MKASSLVRVALFISLFLVLSIVSFGIDNSKALGSWKVSVPNAPEEYSSSTMVVAESEGQLKVRLIFGDTYVLECSGVTFDGETLKLIAGVEGSQIPISGKISGNSLVGTAASPDGDLELTAEKITLHGTWAYKVPDAPYEYSSGKMVFSVKEGNPVAKLVLPNGMEIPVADLKATDTRFTFTMQLEGGLINVSGEIVDGKLVGKSATPQGDMGFTGIKEYAR